MLIILLNNSIPIGRVDSLAAQVLRGWAEEAKVAS